MDLGSRVSPVWARKPSRRAAGTDALEPILDGGSDLAHVTGGLAKETVRRFYPAASAERTAPDLACVIADEATA